jgi:hypothetical protein
MKEEVPRLLEGMEDQTAEDRPDGMELILE